MSQNLISAEFTVEDQQVALAAIQQLQSLPFLIGLSNTEKQSLTKMGAKSRTFVEQAVTVAQQNPEMLPTGFDQEEIERDVALYQALYPISAALSKLNELVEGTLMAVGSDAYTTALDVYAFSKLTDGVTGLEDLRTYLGGRFRSNGSRRPADA